MTADDCACDPAAPGYSYRARDMAVQIRILLLEAERLNKLLAQHYNGDLPDLQEPLEAINSVIEDYNEALSEMEWRLEAFG